MNLASRRCARIASLAFPLAAAVTIPAKSDDCPAIQVATSAIDSWERMRSVHLSGAAHTKVITDFCAAAGTLTRQGTIPSTRVETAAPDTIVDYLNRVSRADAAPRTMEATLGEKLGYAGLSRPVANAYALLSIQYARSVDYINIDGERHSPLPTFLVVAGPTTVEGFVQKSVVCTLRLTVSPATPVSVRC
jgi:hypothetical protein